MNSPSSNSTIKTYLQGFILCLSLTTGVFFLVWQNHLPHSELVGLIMLAAILQLLVQLRFFLHVDTSPTQRWALIPLLYTLIIIGILVGGTLWIMYNTSTRMM